MYVNHSRPDLNVKDITQGLPVVRHFSRARAFRVFAVRAKCELTSVGLVAYKLLASCVASLIKEATMLKKVVLAVGLTAIPSIALAQQQQCQLECTWVNQTFEKTKSLEAATP